VVNKAFLLDLAERSVWTFLQTAGALWVANAAQDAVDIPFWDNLKVAALAGVIAVVKGLIASRVGNSGTAQALPGVESAYVNKPVT
jgi:hypothetical protein